MFKKTLYFLLALMLLFTAVPIYAFGITDYMGHWAEKNIEDWLHKGYVSGYPDGSFKPEGFVTRAEFVKMVNLSFGYTELDNINFLDVDKNDWFYIEIQKGFKAGYINGISSDKFAPESHITREQAAVIICKILELDSQNDLSKSNFSDHNNISLWAKNYVNLAANLSIVQGYENNSFKPQNPIKRAEAIKVLQRAIEQRYKLKDLVIEQSDTVLKNTAVNNIIISKKVGDGSVTLENVVIANDLLVEGLGEKTKVLIKTKDISNINIGKIIIDVNSSIKFENNKYKLSSSNSNIAKISSNGSIIANEPGNAVISASIKGKTMPICEITVRDPDSRTIRILAIGNSFSQDTVFYLHSIAKSANMNIVVGNLYNSGCSLERHCTYAANNNKAYTYYKWSTGDMETYEDNTMKNVLLDEKWDYITLQQSSAESGIYSTYQPYLNDLITYIKNIAGEDVKFAYNMTWAYAANSTNNNFYYYNSNQKIMFNAIVNSYGMAAKETNIDILIPAGTAIQNARTNKKLKAIGNELTSDGYHLNTGIGRYIASLALFETIIREENIQKDLFEDVTFVPQEENAELYTYLSKKAVMAAVDNPYEIKTIK